MSALIPFESAKLPAHLAAFQADGDDLTAGASGGYPVISIKGKVFAVTRGDERTIIQRPEEPGVPAAAIEVVILRANPGLSKNYYEHGYVEGSTDKPDCYSNDGITPGADAQKKQSAKCATCPQNEWGSKISDNGTKVKACADSRRIAVAASDQINDPMLLRVPAASLKVLAEYGNMLKKRGVQYPAVVTRISFDFAVAHPALTFKPVGFLTEELSKLAIEIRNSDIVSQIVGTTPSPRAAALPPPEQEQLPTMAPVQKAATEPAKLAPKKKAAAPAEPKAAEPVKEADVVQPTTAAVKLTAAKPLVLDVGGDDLESALSTMLSGEEFD